MELNNVQDVLNYAHSRFKYSSDQSRTGRPESWCALPANFDQDFQLNDDCEGFAMFCRGLIIDHLPNVETNLAICKIDGQGHCILRTMDPKGNEWFLDNRFRHLQTLDDLVDDGYSFVLLSGPQPGDPYYWVKAESIN